MSTKRLSIFSTILVMMPILIFFFSPSAAIAAKVETLTFTIGIPGKTGCLVCHQDKALVKYELGKPRSLYVNPEDFSRTHAEVTCIDCHTDFTYKSIKPSREDWRVVAGTSCKNCHDEKKKIDHRKNYADYRESIHGRRLLVEKNMNAPTCAGCHNFHRIRRLSDPVEMMEFRKEAYQVCGRCHQDYWDNYNDWFHGKGYKHGAPDAPPCWDCHGAHNILNSKDSNSPTNISRLQDQCAKCHKDADRAFAEYGRYIHSRNDLIRENLVMKIIFTVLDFVKNSYQRVTGYFKIVPS